VKTRKSTWQGQAARNPEARDRRRNRKKVSRLIKDSKLKVQAQIQATRFE